MSNRESINTTLAGVEGKCPGGKLAAVGTVLYCVACGSDIEDHADYPSDLNACLRVARKLGVDEVYFCNVTGSVGLAWIVDEGVQKVESQPIDIDNPALTLSTMLAETAKEREL